MNETNRSLNSIRDEVTELKTIVEDVQRATLILLRVTFVLLIVIIIGLIWG